MSNIVKLILKQSVIATSLLVATNTFAVNGAFDFGFSEITRGMAGAGSALPQDSLISAINPAGLVRVKKQLDLGAVLYLPTMTYNADATTTTAPSIIVAPGKVKSKVPFFFLPDFGINMPIDQKSTFGVALYSLGGFGTKFETNNNASINGTSLPGPLGDGTLESDLKQAVTSFTYSRKFLKRSSWGVSLLVGLQALKSNGAGNLSVLSAHPNNISGKGTDYSVGGGAKIGVLFGLSKTLDLSLSYQPKMLMTKFSKYAGLLPNAGELDIPAFGNIGVAWHIKPNFVFAADIVKIWFKDIPAYGKSNNALQGGGSCTPMSKGSTCMGGKNGAGFGWNNAVIYKIGAQWAINNKTTLRGGYNHSNQILNSNYATENMITPGALVQDIFTLGVSQKLSKKDSINGMFVFIPKQTLRSLNKFSGANQQYVTTSTKGIGFGISWSHTLG